MAKTLEKSLKSLGFGKNEIKVYLALFVLGKVKAGEIIDYTNLHRNLVYTTLENLEERRLITKVLVNGVAEFSPNEPSSLLEEIQNKEDLAKEIIQELEKIKKESSREVTVYEGIDGIKRARKRFLDLPAGETFYVMGATNLSTSPKMEKFWQWFHKKRDAKGIKLKILFEKSKEKNIEEAVEWRNNLKNSEARYLPFSIESPIWMAFCQDRFEFGIPGDNPLTFSIKSKEAAAGFRKYFEYFWNQKNLTLEGENAFEDLCDLVLQNENENLYVIGANGLIWQDYKEELEEFNLKRIKNKNKIFRLDTFDRYKNKPGVSLYAESKRLPKGFEGSMVLWVFGDYVATIIWGKPTTIFVVKDHEVAKHYLKYYNALANISTEY